MKDFLVIGNLNAVTYKEVFPLIKANNLWLGVNNGNMAFRVPSDSEPRATRYWQDATGQKWRSLGNSCWFTNLEHDVRHKPIPLTARYMPEAYPRYDNNDAIEVSRTENIPCDYDGVMGVPISFLDKWCTEQFEIVDIAHGGVGENIYRTKVYTKGEYPNSSDLNAAPVLKDTDGNMRITFPRILIKRK